MYKSLKNKKGNETQKIILNEWYMDVNGVIIKWLQCFDNELSYCKDVYRILKF